jgi:hypothetical protein
MNVPVGMYAAYNMYFRDVGLPVTPRSLGDFFDAFLPRSVVARVSGIRTEVASVNANVGRLYMEIFVEIDFVSAVLPFYEIGQSTRQTQVAASVKRQPFVGIEALSVDHLSGNVGQRLFGSGKQNFQRFDRFHTSTIIIKTKKAKNCMQRFFTSIEITRLISYLREYSSDTESFLRPLARRAANTLRPDAVDILSLNPCLFFLFLFDG